MIILRALDPNCLSLRTATSLRDKRTNDEVAANLEQLAEFGQIATDQIVTLSDHLFMVFHGTLQRPRAAPPAIWPAACRNRLLPRAMTSCCWCGR